MTQIGGLRAGPELKASLVIYFKAGVTEGQINDFMGNLRLAMTLGHRLAKGETEICDHLRIYPALQGHPRMAFTFCEGTAKEDRETITRAIESSPSVYKVMKDVAPVDVRSIDE